MSTSQVIQSKLSEGIFLFNIADVSKGYPMQIIFIR